MHLTPPLVDGLFNFLERVAAETPPAFQRLGDLRTLASIALLVRLKSRFAKDGILLFFATPFIILPTSDVTSARSMA